MLPFPRAHYWIAALLVLTFIGFWPSYFAIFGEASFAHHLHGLTATLWMVLLIGQSVTIHRRKFRAHAWWGRTSLVLIPLLTAGGLLVTKVTILKDTPFRHMFGLNLAFADLVASVFIPLSFYLALRNRRSPDLHARYLLATVFPLIGPVVARVLANHVPGFMIEGPQDLYKFGYAADASFYFSVAFLLTLIAKDYRDGKPVAPFTLGLAAVLGMFAYRIIGFTAWWRPLAETLASAPSWLVVASGLALGGAAAWLGWTRPNSRPAIRRADKEERAERGLA